MPTGPTDHAHLFRLRGYIDPVSLLSPAAAASCAAALETGIRALPGLGAQPACPAIHWAKTVHLRLPAMAELGTRPEILDLVTRILGPDVLLWGSELVIKGPGQAHRWHVDVEHMQWQGVTVWLGLTNMNTNSGIKLIPGSHRCNVTPQELAGADLTDDAAILAALQAYQPWPQVVQPPIRPGAFIIFAGRAWHSTVNQTQSHRHAVILQYCRPDARVRVPRSYEIPTAWDERPPWVMQAAGVDRFGLNHRAPPG
jgi:ectoine hydroxylase-related dioxygenase (phytanoyl-CoA dioxygenase family)